VIIESLRGEGYVTIAAVTNGHSEAVAPAARYGVAQLGRSRGECADGVDREVAPLLASGDFNPRTPR
jgi:hypothetical protein